MSRLSGLIATTGIELLTYITPNGWEVSIPLEELKEKYGTEYSFQTIDTDQNIQKEPRFTNLNANGCIPLIAYHNRGGFAVFEGSAILTYLARHYDTENEFSFTTPDDLSSAEQFKLFFAWNYAHHQDCSWQHAGIGPNQGQLNHFYRYAAEKLPYGIQRFSSEVERLYGVLDTHLQNRDYVLGDGRGRYSIADIASWPRVNSFYFTEVDIERFPNLKKWWQRILQRPAVQQGLKVPFETFYTNEGYWKKMTEDPDWVKQEEQLWDTLKPAQKQYSSHFSVASGCQVLQSEGSLGSAFASSNGSTVFSEPIKT